MKIIKNGIIKSAENKSENYWWLDYEFRCKCECVFTLDRSDFFKVTHTYDGADITLNCPHCNRRIRLTAPTPKVPEGPKLTIEEMHNSLFVEIFGEGGIFHKIFGEKPFKK